MLQLLSPSLVAALLVGSGPTVHTAHTLLSRPFDELAAAAGPDGARHIWRLLRNGDDPEDAWSADTVAEVTGLGQRRRAEVLEAHTPLRDIAQLTHATVAADGTRKLLLRLRDGLEVETVVIPPLPTSGAASARARTTVCISSQVGCRMGCAFCATGRMGLLRDLTVDEILVQAHFARAAASTAGLPPLSNAVFMGMGEPAENAPRVRAAVRCLTDSHRFGFSQQSVVVSTVAPSVGSFGALLEGWEGGQGPMLAWSLHAADEALRKQLVPTATASPTELRDALADALLRRDPRRRRILVEYCLIAGVNDGVADAELLHDFLLPLNEACHDPQRDSKRTGVLVNLIPYNPGVESPHHQRAADREDAPAATAASAVNGEEGDGAVVCAEAVGEAVGAAATRGGRIPHHSHFKRPSWSSVDAFQAKLRELGTWTSVRSARGDDTASACGQLATSTQLKRQAQAGHAGGA